MSIALKSNKALLFLNIAISLALVVMAVISVVSVANAWTPPSALPPGGTAGSLIPSGMVGMFNTSCPTGWTYLSGFANKFPRGSSSYGSTGGSDTHAHGAGTLAGPYHTHTSAISGFGGAAGGGWDGMLQPNNGGNSVYATAAPENGGAGNGAVTGSTASGDNVPGYVTVVFCLKS
ncbi:MAG: hypothetical protein WC461_03060 [Candidatus Paceibacterota bacterium]